MHIYMYTYMYIYTVYVYICVYINKYIYIYLYIYGERDGDIYLYRERPPRFVTYPLPPIRSAQNTRARRALLGGKCASRAPLYIQRDIKIVT